MKPITLQSMTQNGASTHRIGIQIDRNPKSLNNIIIVGLGDTTIQESKERIKAALKNSQFGYTPPGKITINLTPGNLPKHGSSFELAIAIGIIAQQQHKELSLLKESIILGELSLDGTVRPIAGILPMTFAAQKENIKYIFVPKENFKEASLIEGIQIIAITHINELISYIDTQKLPPIPKRTTQRKTKREVAHKYDFKNIKGHKDIKKKLIIAIAGNHNILLSGPPGSGKTLLAKAAQSISPCLSKKESLELTCIYSLDNKINPDNPLITQRPFRSIHPSATSTALIGGGNSKQFQPGEITLAHKGILFIDEINECKTEMLELLRQPLEDKYITISRAHGSTTFPASFAIIATNNPCPCGYFNNGYARNDSLPDCTCAIHEIKRYQKRISGPLLDRFDIHTQVEHIEHKQLFAKTSTQSSRKFLPLINRVKKLQEQRFKNENISSNAEMNNKLIQKHCRLSPACKDIAKQFLQNGTLTTRGFYKSLKVARTIADLNARKNIHPNDLLLAISIRPKMS